MSFVSNGSTKLPDINININGSRLDLVKSFTYLGMVLDNRLTFQQHYYNLAKKLAHKIHLLSRIRCFMDKRTALTIYKTHLLSFMEYGGIFLDGLVQQLRTKLQRSQNRCLRICHACNRYTSAFELHQSSKLMSLRYRRKIAIGNVMYKRICKRPLILLSPRRSGNRSSNNWSVKVPFPKTERFRNSTTYNLLHSWKNLPNYIQSYKDLRSFKVQLKKYMYSRFCQDGFV